MLEPGDLLYLPPRWAHDGVAVGGDCMTCSIGFRAPQRGTLGGELVQRLAETVRRPDALSRRAATRHGDAGRDSRRRCAFAATPCGGSSPGRARVARALGEC